MQSFLDGRTKKQFFEEEIAPQEYLIENYGDWAATNSASVPPAMYYGIFKANELKTRHETSSGVKFDLVIRARMDLFFESYLSSRDIQKSMDDPNLIFVSLPGNKPDHRFITDIFAFGSSNAMNVYSGVWEDIRGKSTNGPAELFLQNRLQKNGIKHEWSLETRYRICNKWNQQTIEIWGDF